jgi:hypothetical protein
MVDRVIDAENHVKALSQVERRHIRLDEPNAWHFLRCDLEHLRRTVETDDVVGGLQLLEDRAGAAREFKHRLGGWMVLIDQLPQERRVFSSVPLNGVIEASEGVIARHLI